MTIATHTLIMDKHAHTFSISLTNTHTLILSLAYVALIIEERLGEDLTERNGLKQSGWEIVKPFPKQNSELSLQT
jgi:hypothetical protein